MLDFLYNSIYSEAVLMFIVKLWLVSAVRGLIEGTALCQVVCYGLFFFI
jgi:hypothetical protein